MNVGVHALLTACACAFVCVMGGWKVMKHYGPYCNKERVTGPLDLSGHKDIRRERGKETDIQMESKRRLHHCHRCWVTNLPSGPGAIKV